MKQVFKKPYIFWFIIIFLVYLILTIMFCGFYNTLPLIIRYAQTVNWLNLGISLLLTLAIAFFISYNSILIYIKHKQRQQCKKETTLAGVGAAGGLITGVCPLCITGLVPLILGTLGISFSFASLPFQGIEVQVLILVVLLISFSQLRT